MALGNGVAEAPATHLKGALFALGSPPRGALLGTAQRHRARRPPAVCARCAVCPTPSPASAAATTRAPRAPSSLRAPTHPPRRRGAAHAQKRQRPRKKRVASERSRSLAAAKARFSHALRRGTHGARARRRRHGFTAHIGAPSPRARGVQVCRPLVRLHLLLLGGPATWGGRGIRSLCCGIHGDQLCFPYACIVSRRDSTREKAPAAAAIGTDRRVSRLPPEFADWSGGLRTLIIAIRGHERACQPALGRG